MVTLFYTKIHNEFFIFLGVALHYTIHHINKSIVTFLVKQNYEVDEVIHGILYSMYVDKSPADIIEMHNPPTSNWEVVADDLGITQEELDEIHQKMETLDLGMIKGPKGPGEMRF